MKAKKARKAGLALVLILLALASCRMDLVGSLPSSGRMPESPGFPPLPPGPTSPDAVVARLEQYLPQKDYEEIFSWRFGTENWASIMKDYHNKAVYEARHDYYSYENLKRAIYELAYLVYEIEVRDDNGSPSSWNYRSFVTNKATGLRTVVYEEPDFMADWNLDKPIWKETVDFGSFLGEGAENDRRREIAALLANMTQETSGGSGYNPGERERMGLFWNEEIGHEGSTGGAYASPHAWWPPQPGRSYHGRGPIQLSYNYNYGLFSAIVFQDKMVLLENPELLVKPNPPGGDPVFGHIGGVLGFKAAIWFWMTPQSPKPSCHQVILSDWKPTAFQARAGWEPGLGATIMVINGGLEGGLSEDQDYRVGTRVRTYRLLAERTKADISGEKLDTKGMGAL